MAPPEPTVHDVIITRDDNKAKAMLEENPALIVQQDRGGRIPLHWAASIGSQMLVDYLLDHDSMVGLVDASDEANWTPLIIAASAGKLEIVETLIGKGADVNAKNSGGHSALQYAASKNHAEIVELLIANNADPNIADEMSSTPAHRAASLGNLKILAFLLEKCAKIDVNSKDKYGNTPLHLACEEDRVKEAELLILSGARTDVENKEKKTAFDLATPETAKILSKIQPKS